MGVTSTQSPIRVAFVPGHLTGLSGRVGITIGPGKHDTRWHRDLDEDLSRLREAHGVDVLVSLMEPDERQSLGMQPLPERARHFGLEFHELPVVDGSVPASRSDFEALVRSIVEAAAAGRNVVVHCRGGLGRSGMTVAAVLRARGLEAERAIAEVRHVRPGAVETDEQARFVHASPGGELPALPVSFDRFAGCLLGGAIGDALGYPVEFDNAHSIVTRWGHAPPEPLAYADVPPAVVSDDTQMTLFTAEGLIAAEGPRQAIDRIQAAYLRWLATQTGGPAAGGWLLGVERLHARRAPGNTCLSALMAQSRNPHQPSVSAVPNDSKGCGAIMRSAPIGLAAASREVAFELGRDAGVLTHGHPSGYLSAGYFAALIHDLSRGADLREAMTAADGLLACEFGAAETQSAIALAKELALGGPPSAAALESLGGGWTGESALGIALSCVLSSDSVPETLWRAVAHGGDSDSTGSLVGNLLGALHGTGALPPRWRQEVELADVIATVSADLYDQSVLGARMDRERYG
ncbi:MAG: ADP-ribosylglycohydrolase family protein [Polyangiaceae bacterium]|nr:ADP-ribosylglycohydrolase family protein [Polyangiaceae bacterium]